MKPTMRRYQKDEDYWRIRSFLRDVLLLNSREQVSWEVARFDYWRWHGILNMKDGTLEDDVFIWESENGEIAAVLNREAPGSVFLQLHPQRRTDGLETEMLSVAEQYLAVPTNTNRRSGSMSKPSARKASRAMQLSRSRPSPTSNALP